MTDQELLKILDQGGELSVPYFGGSTVRVEPCNLEPDVALPSLRNFLGLGDAQRSKDAPHLLAYCASMVDEVGDCILEDLGGRLPTENQVWEFVRPGHIYFDCLEEGEYATTRTVFLQLEGEVAWEPEHGLQMSWAEGSRLVKVGPFDGHPTNGHATADPSNDRFVYHCYEPEFCTLF